MQTLCVTKEMTMNSQLKQRQGGSLDLVTSEVIIRTDCESSFLALDRTIEEKLKEAGVKAMQKHKPSVRQQISRTRREWRQNCEGEGSRVGPLRTITARCHSREITCFTPVVCEICCSNDSQITLGFRRAHGRSTVPRRYVPWSEKVFYLEQIEKRSRLKRHVTRGTSSGSKTNLMRQWWARHTE